MLNPLQLKHKLSIRSIPYPSPQQYPPVIICPAQKFKPAYQFSRKDEQQIKRIMTTRQPVGLQILLKYIHKKFSDQGLLYTLIHKVFDCKNDDIEYYVPELVYLAIQKNCKPIKKLLIGKATENQGLRRLIYWNVKAFTVLMKQKDFQIKRMIQEFQQKLIQTVKGTKFNHSQKAIAMITTASLQLKKLQKAYLQSLDSTGQKKNDNYLKQKLQWFIKRYNSQYLNNLNHSIIIPFRRGQDDKFSSTYITRIIQDDCSCFPTRKRVPYRIIIQTVDEEDIKNKSYQPSQQFFKQNKVEPQKDKDLFEEVTKTLQQTLGHSKFKSLIANNVDSQYPYVVDTEENLKLNELSKYAKKIEKIQKEEKELEKDNNLVLSKMKKSFLRRKNTKDSDHLQVSSINKLRQFQILNNPNLQKFQAMYIPTMASDKRNSAGHIQSPQPPLDQHLNRLRWSSNHDQKTKLPEYKIKQYEQETKWNATYEDSAWGMPWVAKEKKYRQQSFFRSFPSLKLHNVVVKGGDDLRQEIVCMQMIYKMREIINRAGVNVFIKPYEIIVLSQNSGILQFVSNSISVDAMKKQRQGMSIGDFFSQVFQTQQKLIQAKQNFIRSLVGSSIITYVLKLKDRHNGNILLDNQGHIIHIDFGFILGMSPGGLNFESSPFKLTEEYVEFMDGKDSTDYQYFQELFCEGMKALRQKSDQLCLVLEIMMENSDLECFKDFKTEAFKEKFKPGMSKEKFHEHCMALIEKSCMNSRTVHYDVFQYYTNGIRA